MFGKGRGKPGKTPANWSGRSKLSFDQVREVRARFKGLDTHKSRLGVVSAVALEYGVPTYVISRVINQRHWQWLD